MRAYGDPKLQYLLTDCGLSPHCRHQLSAARWQGPPQGARTPHPVLTSGDRGPRVVRHDRHRRCGRRSCPPRKVKWRREQGGFRSSSRQA
jgi:hypothetical protein